MTKTSKGPATGAGRGSPKAPPFAGEQAKAASQKGVWMRQQMAAWRKANPDAPESQSERKRMIREILRNGTPDALQALHETMNDPQHKDRIPAAKAWIEQDIGRPMQGVELSGENGGALQVEVIRRVIVDARNPDTKGI